MAERENVGHVHSRVDGSIHFVEVWKGKQLVNRPTGTAFRIHDPISTCKRADFFIQLRSERRAIHLRSAKQRYRKARYSITSSEAGNREARYTITSSEAGKSRGRQYNYVQCDNQGPYNYHF